jgi:NitT/TauT family transport system substrate-binding protein
VGVAGAADVLIACGKGLDLVAIGIDMPSDPTAIVSLSANPIRSIADLRGKRIGVVPGSTSLALLQALLKSNHLGEQDVKLVLIGAGDLISGLMTKRLDAIAAFETTNVPAIRAAGAEPVSLRFADVGMRVPGNVYIANGEYSRKNPDIVTRFMAGTIRGWEDVYRNGSSEGLAILVKAYPELATQSAFLTTIRHMSAEIGSQWMPLSSTLVASSRLTQLWCVLDRYSQEPIWVGHSRMCSSTARSNY